MGCLFVKIIGGIYRGRSLKSPQSSGTRPTTGFIREALFNIIGPQVQGKSFLDIFAGTGAVGIEAISRGASSASFIENDPRACSNIITNIKALNIGDKAKLIKADALSALKKMDKSGQSFDIIFIDPPYYEDLITPLLIFLRDSNLVNQIVIIQYPKDELIDNAGFIEKKHKIYGKTALSFLAKE